MQLIFRALKSLIGEHRRPENVTYNNNNNIGAVLLISLKTDKQKKFLYSCEINTSLSDSLIDHVYSQKNNGPKLFVQRPPVPQKFLVFFFKFICIRKKNKESEEMTKRKEENRERKYNNNHPFFLLGGSAVTWARWLSSLLLIQTFFVKAPQAIYQQWWYSEWKQNTKKKWFLQPP